MATVAIVRAAAEQGRGVGSTQFSQSHPPCTMRRRVFAATAAVGGACAIFRRPADGRPSIADALAPTPALPALVRADRAARPPSSSALESAAFDARAAARALRCVACATSIRARPPPRCRAVARHDGNLGAVALEIDARTLAMVDAAAAGARRRAGRRRPRGDGARGAVGAAVCAARRLLRERAAAAGDCAAAQGVLYAREMAEAAAAAVAAGAPVHCLRAVQDSSLQSRARSRRGLSRSSPST